MRVARSGWALEVVFAIVRRFVIRLVVCGSSESRPAIARLIPLIRPRSWSGPPLSAMSSSARITLNLSGSIWEISALELSSTDHTGVGVFTRSLSNSMTAPSARYGPSSVAGRKSMYCSPAPDSACTETIVSTGIRYRWSILAVAAMAWPRSISSIESTLPTRYPRSVTSLPGCRPPERSSCTVTVYSARSGFTRITYTSR
ncbi:Uncharacterised protein [Mycobacteroides abscessus subsp. abscessus]|nr:Uncharacterised protein [Mycobacteroides abscessus subsp. abscessus]